MSNDDVVLVSWNGRIFGQRIIATRHYVVRDLEGPINTIDALASMMDLIAPGGGQDKTTPYLNCLASNYAMETCRAQVISPVRQAYYEENFVFNGNWDGIAHTGYEQGGLTWRTAFSGRTQVATNKIGPLGESASVAGLLTAGIKTDMANLGAAWLTSINDPLFGGLKYYPVIYHAGLAPINWDYILSYVVQPESRCMTRRVVGRGE